MRLLIDTHALIWFCEGNAALSQSARLAMEDESNERFVSQAVPWEMAIKLSIGKLHLETDFMVIFPGVLEANGFALLPTRLEHLNGIITLPRHHGDPFDRLMISQAQADKLTIITCDEHFVDYGIPLLW